MTSRQCRCDNTCSFLGAQTCEGRWPYVCTDRGHGCFEWSSPGECDQGERCTRGSCVPCAHECQRGDRYTACSGDWAMVRYWCARDSDGCWHWDSRVTSCVGDGVIRVCEDGECVAISD